MSRLCEWPLTAISCAILLVALALDVHHDLLNVSKLCLATEVWGIVTDKLFSDDCSYLSVWNPGTSCPYLLYWYRNLMRPLCAIEQPPGRQARVPFYEVVAGVDAVAAGMQRLKLKSVEDFNRQPTLSTRRSGHGGTTALRQIPFFWVPGLTAKPRWPREAFDWVPRVEARWGEIRDEFLELNRREGLSSYNIPEFWGKRQVHGWKTFHLVDQRGGVIRENIAKVPKTWEILQSIPRVCLETMLMFSVAMPRVGGSLAHVGYSNMLLRAHLPIVNKEPAKTFIEVGGVLNRWQEGELMFFDDTFWHAFKNYGDTPRVVLFFDVWHPDIRDDELPPVIEAYRTFNARADMKRQSEYLQEIERNSTTIHVEFPDGPS